MLTNCLAECAHLTITVSQIQRDIGRKSSFFKYPLAFDAPVRGVPVRISPPRLVWKNKNGVATRRWKKIRRYIYSFWRNSRTWQKDRHRMPTYTALMHFASLGKNQVPVYGKVNVSCSLCTKCLPRGRRERIWTQLNAFDPVLILSCSCLCQYAVSDDQRLEFWSRKRFAG